MGHSFLSQVARNVVESYIARNAVRAPVAQPQIQIEPLIDHIEPQLMPIEPQLILPSPAAQDSIFVSLPETPPNGRVTEIDFKQAAELDEINQRSNQPEPASAESVDAIYNRYLTQFPIFPELSQSSQTQQAEQEAVVSPSEPASPVRPDTFVVVDLGP